MPKLIPTPTDKRLLQRHIELAAGRGATPAAIDHSFTFMPEGARDIAAFLYLRHAAEAAARNHKAKVPA